MKSQIEICKEYDREIEHTIHGCRKKGRYFWYGPGCKNIDGTCPMYKKIVEEKERRSQK